MAEVIFTLMKDESRLTTDRANVFSRTNEHAKYIKHLIMDCRDAIIPALVEVQDFVREITTATKVAEMIDANKESGNETNFAFACLSEIW